MRQPKPLYDNETIVVIPTDDDIREAAGFFKALILAHLEHNGETQERATERAS
jgi:hypothetical protein